MERIAIEKLKKWNDSKRRKPLIVWGARQVGKTYLIKDIFANRIFIMTDNDVEGNAKAIYCLTHENADIKNVKAGKLEDLTDYLIWGSALSEVVNEYYGVVREIAQPEENVAFKDIKLNKQPIAHYVFNGKFVSNTEIKRISNELQVSATYLKSEEILNEKAKEKEMLTLKELETY